MSSKWLLVFVLFPALAFASENCVTQYNGICRDVCTPAEEPAEGAFIDCAEKQECCVAKAAPRKKTAGAGDVMINGLQKKTDPQK